jgi:hypothetical protein
MKNIKINRKKGIVEIIINPEFYPKETIVHSFKEIKECFYSLKENDKNFFVELKPKRDVDLEEVAYDFMDMLLSKIKGS